MPSAFTLSDKVIHAVMYAFLAAAWMVPVMRRRRGWMVYVCVCAAVTAYGGLIEALQRFCTLTRSGEMADLVADFVGALIGVAIVVLVAKYKMTKR